MKKDSPKWIRKRHFFLILIVALLFASWGGGNGFFPAGWLHPEIFNKAQEVKEDSPKEKKVLLPMHYVNEKLYLSNWSCPDEKTLQEVIGKIKQKYLGQEIHIKYQENPEDPYLSSVSTLKILNEQGFYVSRQKDG